MFGDQQILGLIWNIHICLLSNVIERGVNQSTMVANVVLVRIGERWGKHVYCDLA